MVRQPSPAQPSHGEGAKEWKYPPFPTRAGGVSKLGNANTGRLLCHPVCPEHAGELPATGIQRKALRWTRRPRWSGFLTMAENSGLARATPVLLSIDEKSGNNSQKETLQKSNGDFNGTSKYMENY